MCDSLEYAPGKGEVRIPWAGSFWKASLSLCSANEPKDLCSCFQTVWKATSHSEFFSKMLLENVFGECRKRSVGAQLYRECGIHCFRISDLVIRQETKGKGWVCILKLLGFFGRMVLPSPGTWHLDQKTSKGNFLSSDSCWEPVDFMGRLGKEVPLREEIKPGAFFCHWTVIFLFFLINSI